MQYTYLAEAASKLNVCRIPIEDAIHHLCVVSEFYTILITTIGDRFYQTLRFVRCQPCIAERPKALCIRLDDTMDIIALYTCAMLRVEKSGCLPSPDSICHQRSSLLSNSWILVSVFRITVPSIGISLTLMYCIDAAATIFCSGRSELCECHIEATALLDACSPSYSNIFTYALVYMKGMVPAACNSWRRSFSVTSAGRLLRFRYLPAWTHRQRTRIPSLVLVRAKPSCLA